MGLGIEARYLRCKAFWKRHLELSKEFQVRGFERLGTGGTAAILGAGRLLDVASESLLSRFNKICLVDADPSARAAWRRLRKQLRPGQQLDEQVCDLTGSIENWTRQLRSFLNASTERSPAVLAEFLLGLRTADLEVERCDLVVSLNLLSQIGIYWKDRFEAAAADWNVRSDEHGNFQEPVASALADSLRKLEEQHLGLLSATGAQVIVILTDSAYLYYTRDRAEWQEEQALQLRNVHLNGYSLCEQDTWFWHIAPQGIEQPDYGAIHQVQALCFVRA